MTDSPAASTAWMGTGPPAVTGELDESIILRALIDHTREYLYAKDRAGRFVFVNRAWVQHFDLTDPSDVIGVQDVSLFHPERAAAFAADEQLLMVSGEPIVDRLERHSGPGMPERWMLTTKIPMRDEQGQVIGLVGSSRDVTDRRAAEAALEQERDLLHQLMDNLPDQVFFKDVGSHFIRINRAGALALGLDDPSEAVGRSDADYMAPDVAERYVDEDRALMASGRPLVDRRQPFVLGDGTRRWVSTTKAPTIDAAGGVTGIVGISRDVTEQVRLEGELRFQGELLDQVTAAVIAMDPTGVVTHWNRHAERLYGWTRLETVGRRIDALTVGPTEDATARAISEHVALGQRWEGDYHARTKDGGTIFVHVSVAPVVDASGRVVGTVGVAVDISERRALEEQLASLAYADSLTGLANRAGFRDRLRSAMDTGLSAAVVLVDLDRFKAVNDRLGHAAGDQLLIQVARRLGAELRPGDTLARLGGDEFAALLPGATGAGAGAVVGRFLAALATPFAVGHAEAVISGCAGIALIPGDGAGVDEILSAADLAMYEAKRAGRGGFAAYDEVTGAGARDRTELEADLRLALGEEHLFLEYQPFVDLASGAVTGFEALVRWRHPTRGVIPPAAFIPLAEETGLIVPIGEWVLGEACRQAAAWRALWPDLPLVMAVNVSPRQFPGHAFGHALWRVLGETGLPPDHLTLEVTEQALAEDDEVTAAFLRSIKSLGVRIALDDFGIGYSSLGRLHLLPLDVLKLDRSFVSRLGREPHAAAFVRAVVALGHDLGLVVTAEGIETSMQRRMLVGIGCDRGQGYLFGRPLSTADATDLFSGHDRRWASPPIEPEGAAFMASEPVVLVTAT